MSKWNKQLKLMVLKHDLWNNHRINSFKTKKLGYALLQQIELCVFSKKTYKSCYLRVWTFYYDYTSITAIKKKKRQVE